MANYYETLGVARDATAEQIKEAWRSKIKEHHPDIGGDENKAKEINKAYEVLSDPQERAAYDSGGRRQPGVSPGFNPFQAGGFNIDVNEILRRMHGNAGGQAFHFSATTQIIKEVNVSLIDVINQSEIDINVADAFGGNKKIKFKLPENFKSGITYTLRIGNDNAQNQGVTLVQLRLNLVLPRFSALSTENRKKLLEILNEI